MLNPLECGVLVHESFVATAAYCSNNHSSKKKKPTEEGASWLPVSVCLLQSVFLVIAWPVCSFLVTFPKTWLVWKAPDGCWRSILRRGIRGFFFASCISIFRAWFLREVGYYVSSLFFIMAELMYVCFSVGSVDCCNLSFFLASAVSALLPLL